MPAPRSLALLEAYRRQPGGLPWARVGSFHHRRASSLGGSGRHREALEEAREAHRVWVAEAGEGAQKSLVALNLVGMLQKELGDLREARRTLERSVELAPDSGLPRSVQAQPGRSTPGPGRSRRARGLYEEILAAREQTLGAEHPQTVATRRALEGLDPEAD